MNRTEEYIYYNELYDLYGNLLNEREKEIFQLFYEEDLSLQEIASERGVSKSAIGTAIKTIHKKLNYYEKHLHLKEKRRKLIKILDTIEDRTMKEKIKELI